MVPLGYKRSNIAVKIAGLNISLGLFANSENRLLASSCLPVCLSVCPSAWNSSAPTGRIFVKFDVLDIFRKSVEEFTLIKIRQE